MKYFLSFKIPLHVLLAIFCLTLLVAKSTRAEGPTAGPAAGTAAGEDQRQKPVKTSGPQSEPGTSRSSDQPVPAGFIVLNVADIATSVDKFVVSIQSPTDEGGTSYGSGFLIDERGLLVTNFHVIHEAVKNGGPITVVTTDGDS